MSTFRVKDAYLGTDYEITVNRRFPNQWRVTIGDKTRRGFGFGFKNAADNALFALHTWNMSWFTRARINTRALARTLLDIPLAVYRADKATFDLGDRKFYE